MLRKGCRHGSAGRGWEVVGRCGWAQGCEEGGGFGVKGMTGAVSFKYVVEVTAVIGLFHAPEDDRKLNVPIKFNKM